ncbi:MAG: hypothetical protein A2Z21_10620 [Candidatus Fraserbacteria bacterium RBG_16_55_9]|uniref:DUF3137 domain-containing protein n=1 Tax=Fraserbacteria sp. (strain RBG_16_55_9) TaxID=1817864 RepID=A0A1F5URD4_FRAXR|nr:MAG: hypothetical protein A2Z21_10620 [Candidatus Fraserbacteria bacterium RBG_16_55_9]
METLVVFLIILLAVVFWIWQSYSAAKRQKELAAWATAKHLRFDPSRDYAFGGRFTAFRCLNEGSQRYAYNRMHGEWLGQEFVAFDFHYETYTTDSKGRTQTHHHHFSAAILGTSVPLKSLYIRPEGLLDKLTEFLGFDDIDFESLEFSRRFYVKATDRRWAYDVVHPRVMEFLLTSPAFSIQFDAHHVIAYRASLFSAQEFGSAVEVIGGILSRLPEYLVKQQASGS